MTQFQAILAKALALDPDDRAALVETLRARIDTLEAIDRAWAAEIERRSAEFESGAVEAIPAETVLAEAWAFLKWPRR